MWTINKYINIHVCTNTSSGYEWTGCVLAFYKV